MLQLLTVVAALALASAHVGVSAQPDPLGSLWESHRAALVRVACKPGDIDERYCRAIELRDSRGTQLLGTGYMRVRLLWQRHGTGPGPDALVLGDYGGSGGLGDLFAVTLRPRPVVKQYSSERLDNLRAKPSAGLRLDLPLDVEFFNGAPHAGATTVVIPTVWANGDFSPDLAALVRPAISKQELDFRELAMEQELRGWAEANYPASRLYPPEAASGTRVTVQALMDLMLIGHADQARALLDRAWPRQFGRSDLKLGGEQGFWDALCGAVANHPLWRRLRLQRLPHSDIIGAGANSGPSVGEARHPRFHAQVRGSGALPLIVGNLRGPTG